VIRLKLFFVPLSAKSLPSLKPQRGFVDDRCVAKDLGGLASLPTRVDTTAMLPSSPAILARGATSTASAI
jgi:hypothetical protein